MTNTSQIPVRILILIFLILNTLLLSSMELFPFVDLPNHLAEASIFKYYEPANLIGQYYTPTPWYFPNTFHTVFCSLFPSVEWGNRIFHILYIVALQLSVFLVIKELKGNPWYGLLAILFTYNYNVSFGFVGFAVSIPVLIFLFYTILLYIRTGKVYLTVVIASLLLLLFFMHAQNALMGLVMYGFMLLYHFRRSVKQLLIHAVTVPVPLVIIIFTWWYTRDEQQPGESTFDYLVDYYTSSYFTEFLMRARIIVFDNFQLRDGLPGLVIATFFFLCVLIPLVAYQPWKRKISLSQFGPNLIYAGIFFLITFACYLFVPDKLPGQTPLFQRFCTIAILSLIIVGSILLRDYNRSWLKYFVIFTVVIYTVLWSEYIISFNRENRNFDPEFFEGVGPDATLAGLIYESRYRGRKVYIHFPNYYIVWKGGIAASKIIDYRFGVVRRTSTKDTLPYYHELIGDDYGYQPQYQNLDYLLVRGAAPEKPDSNLNSFVLEKRSGPWALYKNTRK